MEHVLSLRDGAVQRTWDLQIACTCRQAAHCPRFHGLPLRAAEFMALLPGVASHQKEREALYALYDREPTAEAFNRLTAPFNSYRREA
jgi:hypothetical protein